MNSASITVGAQSPASRMTDIALGAVWVDLLILAVFTAFGLLCFRFRVSYRLSVTIGLITLALAAVVMSLGEKFVGNFVAVLAYYFLVVGVGLATIEWKREAQTTSERAGSTDALAARRVESARARDSGLRAAAARAWDWLRG